MSKVKLEKIIELLYFNTEYFKLNKISVNELISFYVSGVMASIAANAKDEDDYIELVKVIANEMIGKSLKGLPKEKDICRK